MSRWHYLDPPLVALLPIAFALHVVEEAVGGFRQWTARVTGTPMPLDAFVLVNVIGLVLFVAGAWIVIRAQRRGWLVVTLATILVANALLHLGGTVLTRAYSPGLFTGIVLYLPIGGLVLGRAMAQASRRDLAIGVFAALALYGCASVIAMSAI